VDWRDARRLRYDGDCAHSNESACGISGITFTDEPIDQLACWRIARGRARRRYAPCDRQAFRGETLSARRLLRPGLRERMLRLDSLNSALLVGKTGAIGQTRARTTVRRDGSAVDLAAASSDTETRSVEGRCSAKACRVSRMTSWTISCDVDASRRYMQRVRVHTRTVTRRDAADPP